MNILIILYRKEERPMIEIPPYSFMKSKEIFVKFFVQNNLDLFKDPNVATAFFEKQYKRLYKPSMVEVLQKFQKELLFQDERYTFTVILRDNTEFEIPIKITQLFHHLENHNFKLNYAHPSFFNRTDTSFTYYQNEVARNIKHLQPIIVLKSPNVDNVNMNLILDGAHRLSTSFYKNADLLPYYILSYKDLIQMPDLFFDLQDKLLFELVFFLQQSNLIRKLNPTQSDDALLNQLNTIQES